MAKISQPLATFPDHGPYWDLQAYGRTHPSMPLRGASICTINSVEAAPLSVSPEGTYPMVCDYCNIATVTPISTIRSTSGDMV